MGENNRWISTQSGNNISKTAVIPQPQFVLISGNSTIHHGVSLISDSLQLGKFVYLDTHTTIESTPCKIGSYTIIGSSCVLNCSKVGNRVVIGCGCTLSKAVIIHDCVIVMPNTFVPEGTNIPPFTIITQDCYIDHNHGRQCGLRKEALNESFKKLIEGWAKTCYINQDIPSSIP